MRYFAVTSVAPGVFKASSICVSMKSAILRFAKPESRAFGSSAPVGVNGPSFRASASAISAAYFGTTTAEALMQERPPLSEMAPAMTSM